MIGYTVLKAGRALDGGLFAWDRAGRYTAAAVLLVAALYELTPLKRVSLSRCRSPLSFLLDSWRDGRAGALAMGFEHGVWCIGCCWALMAALFALGAMSIAWMALVGALIAIEKLLPWRTLAVGGVTLVLVALAIGVAAAPSDVPALTVPGSSSALHAMKAMHSSKPTDMRMPGTSQMNKSG